MIVEVLAFAASVVWTAAAPLRVEVSLNGAWETAVAERIDAPPARAAWSAVTVPGVFRSFDGQRRWLRRRIDVPEAWRGKRVWVRYDGVRWDSRHFVNGQEVGRHFEGFSPCAFDVTDAVRFGDKNELLVGVCDWQALFTEPMAVDKGDGWHRIRHAPKDRILSPIGGRYGDYGIWADAALRVVPPVHIRDITIETSVRRGELKVTAELANDGRSDASVELAGQVVEPDGVTLPAKSVVVGAGRTVTVTSTVPWPSPKLWDYETPHLYHLRLTIRQAGREADRVTQRFGFREFWCDGPWFYLNGVRLICRASSMWPLGAKTVAEAADRLRRLKNINVMCFRTHTQPWRQLWYDAADEVGMLMIPEGPVWNDDNTYRVNDDRFWGHFAADLRGMVERMKNNPSVVAWSLENEMWGGRMNDKTPQAKAALVELGRKMRRWDPTRPIMYESDGDPDGVADVIGIHYPHELPKAYLYPNTCYWMDEPIKPSHWFANGERTWRWRRDKPLYLGEYLWCPSPTPAGYSVMCGDRAYDDYEHYRRVAIALTWQMQTRAYRYYRVSGLCPWTCAGGSLDVAKDPMAAAQADSMRPLAAFVKEANTRFYGGRSIRRTLHIMNDTLHAGRVTVTWRLDVHGKPCDWGELAVEMKPGDLAVRTIALQTPAVRERTDAQLIVTARMAGVSDFKDVIACSVSPPLSLTETTRHPVGLVGGTEETVKGLRAAGLRVQRVENAASIPSTVGILIAAPDALVRSAHRTATPLLRVEVGSAAQRGVDAFLARGGRLLMLAQRSPHLRAGAVRFSARASTMTFPLWPSHPLLRDVRADDLQFWAPEHIVADAHVDRIASGGRAIVVSGDDRGIELAALSTSQVGPGLLVASGLRLFDAVNDEPTAGVILRNALAYMDGWQPEPEPVLIAGKTGDSTLDPALRRTGLKIRRAVGVRDLPDDAKTALVSGDCDADAVTTIARRLGKRGGVVWWHRPSPATFAAVMKRLGQPAQLVAATGPVLLRRSDAFMDGLAQADLYWTAEHPRSSVGWSRTPMDPSIVAHEVALTGHLALDRAMALPADRFKAVGSVHNRPRDGGIMLCTHGAMVGEANFGEGGPTVIGLRARGWPARKIWPRVAIRVAGRLVAQIVVDGKESRVHSRVCVVPPGQQRLEVLFLNDAQTADEDRNVWISHVYVQHAETGSDGLSLHATPAALVSMPVERGRLVVDTVCWDRADGRNLARATQFAHSVLARLGARPDQCPVAIVEAETLEHQKTPHNGPRGSLLILATNGWVRAPIACDQAGRYTLRIVASGSQARGEWPLLTVRLDGAEVARLRIDAATARGFDVPVELARDRQTLELTFVNDLSRPPEDRNIHIDRLEIWAKR